MDAKEEHDYLIKMVLVGDSGVGKTCLLLRYTDDTFSDTFITTIGVDFKIKNRISQGLSLKMQLWDTAGQDRFKSIVSSFYRGADGLVVVFDVTDMESFHHVTRWLEEADHYGSPRCLKILVGNKVDLVKERVVTPEQGQGLADRLGLKYIETSAKTSHRVHEALDELADTIVKAYKEEGVLLDEGGARKGKGTIRMDDTQQVGQGYLSGCSGYCGGQ